MRCLIGWNPWMISLGITAFLMRMQHVSADDVVQKNYLLVAVAYGEIGNLYQIDLQSGAMNPLLTTTSFRPVAVAFDSVEKVVYWTDVEKIGKAKLGESQNYPVNIFRDLNGTSTLHGLALDTEHRKLYYANRGSSHACYEMELDGSRPIKILTGNEIQPEALVVDKENRDLYYTDRGVRPGIYLINLRTWQRKTILTKSLVLPNALAIDFQKGVMYWADRALHSIEMANLDGSGRVTLITDPNTSYFAMAISPEYLYITDSNDTSISRLDRKTHTMAEKMPTVFGKGGLYGIIFYSSSSAADEKKPGEDRSSSSTHQIDEKKPGEDRSSSSTHQIDHTKVTVTAVTVGGVVSIAITIAISACYIAKRRRTFPNAELRYTTHGEQPSMGKSNSIVNGQRIPDDYSECIVSFDTTPVLPGRYA